MAPPSLFDSGPQQSLSVVIHARPESCIDIPRSLLTVDSEPSPAVAGKLRDGFAFPDFAIALLLELTAVHVEIDRSF